MYKIVDDVIPLLQESHYELDEKTRNVTFTDEGKEVIPELREYFDQNPGHYESFRRWIQEKDSVPNRK